MPTIVVVGLRSAGGAVLAPAFWTLVVTAVPLCVDILGNRALVTDR